MIDLTQHRAIDVWNQEVESVVHNISRVIVGKQDVIRMVLVGLIAGGHCLIEDAPGVGKTTLVKATARTLGCHFKRIQFTPDLLPSDVTGVSIYNQGSQEFEFRKGPIFAQIVLADEINRTSPKTQAALLEALEEESVTVDGTTYSVATPFFVLATENPIEYEGTFPLPEAQLDRFLLKFSIGYPSLRDEINILDLKGSHVSVDSLEPVATPNDILKWRDMSARVHVEDELKLSIVQVVQETRRHEQTYLGGSPRASIALYKAAKALAFIAGRNYVVPDDILYLLPYVLRHRLILRPEARFSGVDPEHILRDALNATPLLRALEARGT